MTLASVLPDQPISLGGWTPVNYEHTYQGQVTVVQALFESLNVPTAWVGSKLGPARIVETAHQLGIREDLPAVLPISIGADETTLLELTGAYQVFANAGLQDPPYAVESVVDSAGHLIYRHGSEQRVVDPSVAYLITGALRQVLRYGTGRRHRRWDRLSGGRQNRHHAGLSRRIFHRLHARIVCGVWVGFDEPQSLGMPGAQAALPWASFMKMPSRDSRIFRSRQVVMATIDPQSGGLATTSCPRAISLPFLMGTEPRATCSLHGGMLASAPPAYLADLIRASSGADGRAERTTKSLFRQRARRGRLNSLGGFSLRPAQGKGRWCGRPGRATYDRRDGIRIHCSRWVR